MITGNVIVFTNDDVEQDIVLIMPDGQKMLVQYRAYEGPSEPTIDICLDSPTYVSNWCDDEMTPAKHGGSGVMKSVKQLSFSVCNNSKGE